MKLEPLLNNIQDTSWLQDNVARVKAIIRQAELDDDIIKRLWKIDEFRIILVNHQKFSNNIFTVIMPDLGDTSLSLFQQIVKKQALDISIISRYHDFLLIAGHLDKLLTLWEFFPQQLQELNKTSLVDLIQTQKISYNDRTLIHIFEKAPELLTPSTIIILIKTFGINCLDVYVKRIFFNDKAVECLIDFWYKSDEEHIKNYFYGLLRALIVYDKCAQYKKAAILLLS